jgi:hypothetical protein
MRQNVTLIDLSRLILREFSLNCSALRSIHLGTYSMLEPTVMVTDSTSNKAVPT